MRHNALDRSGDQCWRGNLEVSSRSSAKQLKNKLLAMGISNINGAFPGEAAARPTHTGPLDGGKSPQQTAARMSAIRQGLVPPPERESARRAAPLPSLERSPVSEPGLDICGGKTTPWTAPRGGGVIHRDDTHLHFPAEPAYTRWIRGYACGARRQPAPRGRTQREPWYRVPELIQQECPRA